MTGKIHKPDRRTRELVSTLALNGVAQGRIAEHVGVSEPSLRKHYRRELDLATEAVCARVAKNLIRIASTGSGNAAVQGAKGGWRDIEKGSDQIVAAVLGADRFLTEDFLSDIELSAIREARARARHPDEVRLLAERESDLGHLERGASVMQSWQRKTHNPAVLAAGTQA
jgi:hypothetical protein